MPRSFVRGRQILDLSITDKDLAKDSVITEKIKDGNVTCPKLEPGLCDRLLSSDTPIARIKLLADHPENTNFMIPGGLTYSLANFVDRVAIYRNGQLLYNGLTAPANRRSPIDVWPGDNNTTQVKFDFDLIRGDTIQVIIL